MQSVIEKIKEFIEKDNGKRVKRGIAVIVLFVVLVLVLVKCTGTNSSKKSTEDATESTESSSDFQLAKEFEKDSNEELKALVTDYFNAYAADNLDKLTEIAVPMSDNEKSFIGVYSQYIENYQNITCYSKPGLTKGSYLLSVVLDMKFYGVDTLAPGLEFFYVEKNADGALYINNLYSSYNLARGENELDPNVYSVILQYEQQDDWIALQKQVQESYEQAVAGDENLATMIATTLPNAMNEWVASVNSKTSETTEEQQTTQTETVEQPSEEPEQPAAEEPAQEPEQPVVEKVQIVGTGINIRETPSADGTFIAAANEGETYTKLGTEGDWTKIDYNGTTGYIKSEFVRDVTN